MSVRIDRRALLRGALGVGVGLPLLECMAPRAAHAQAATPRRYAVVFAGQSIGGDGWAKDMQMIAGRRFTEGGHFVAPAAFGRAWAPTTPLAPLAALRDDVSIVSNLAIPFSRTSTDAAEVPPGGAYRDFHGGGASPLLCGVRSRAAAFRAQGITSDQAVAALHASATPHGSLVYRAQPSWYLSGSSFSGRQYISYRGANDPIEAQTSPQLAWRALFTGFTPSGDRERALFDREQRARRSVLDLVAGRRQALVARVGGPDKRRLEQHFDELRALERRIQATPPTATGACAVLADPGADPAVGGDNAGSGSGDIGTNTGYSDESGRARLLADLVHMAFVCDLSRVATLQITSFQSHMNVFQPSTEMGRPIRADLHEVGHNGDEQNRGQLAVSTMLAWHIRTYAYLVDKLKQTREGDGTVLDNAAIVFLPEGGHGLQLNDGSTANQTHSVENMAVLVAGRAGGLRPGQHVDGARRHPVQALLSAMRGVGYGSDTLGEVTGPIGELFQA